MSENNSRNDAGKLLAFSLDTLSFDSFDRDPRTDIVCLAPVRTIVRREEEIVLIRKVRKVEEIDASPACPNTTTQVIPVEQEGTVVYEEKADNVLI
ncbi:MAG TPA: hypothetical protein V6D33_09980 [Cyanophyceae cyanobacterium]